MDNLVLSFHAKVEHGCLVVRDLQSGDDVSDWDPSSETWYKSGSSIIFAVLPESEGWVDCEVWKASPVTPLPISLFIEEMPNESGRLVLHDPNERVRMQFRGVRGGVRISALVDDRDFASKVQLIVEATPPANY
jgi:hypothetical protein